MDKKLSLIILLCCVSLQCVSLMSCSDDREYLGPMERYYFETGDTIVDASEHLFDIAMVPHNGFAPPHDWNFEDLKKWNNDNPVDKYPIDEEWETIPSGEIIMQPDRIEYEWISFEKIMTDTAPILRVSVKKNTTGQRRTVRISVYNDIKKGGSRIGWHYGQVIISQQH